MEACSGLPGVLGGRCGRGSTARGNRLREISEWDRSTILLYLRYVLDCFSLAVESARGGGRWFYGKHETDGEAVLGDDG